MPYSSLLKALLDIKSCFSRVGTQKISNLIAVQILHSIAYQGPVAETLIFGNLKTAF